MQNDNMPQFGIKKQNRFKQPEPVFSAGFSQPGPQPQPQSQPQSQSQSRVSSSIQSSLQSEPQDRPMAFGSASPKLNRPNPFTSLGREQILPALVAFFGFLSLIFMVATIALAVSNSDIRETKSDQNTTTTVRSLSTETLSFTLDKIVDKADGETYKMGQIVKTPEGQQALAVFSDTAGTGVFFEVNWEFASAYYNLSSSRVDHETYKILTNESVADLVIGRASNNQTDDVLLLLLADGTLKYMPIRESLEKNSFRVVGEVSGVSEVVKFYRAYETVNNELTETVMVQQADGKIIDLRVKLLRIVGKDIK